MEPPSDHAQPGRDGQLVWRFGGVERKDYKLAADYFGRLARLKNNDPWLIAAGAYWGYRASIKLKRPDEATSNLRIATRYPRTFTAFSPVIC